MKKYLLIIIVLLCAVAQGTWAQTDISNAIIYNPYRFYYYRDDGKHYQYFVSDVEIYGYVDGWTKLTKNTDFTLHILDGNGKEINDVRDRGWYTLVARGKGNYKGEAKQSIHLGTWGNWKEEGNRAASFSQIDNSTQTITITNEAEFGLLTWYWSNECPDEYGRKYKNWTFRLGCDLDMAEYDFTPLANMSSGDEHEFYGTFDGQGHTIKGVHFDRNNTYWSGEGGEGYAAYPQGLFMFVGRGSVVKNLTLTDSEISTGNVAFAGAIAGYTYPGTTMTNCHVTESVNVICKTSNLDLGSGYRFGGIAGSSQSYLSGCTSAAKVFKKMNAGVSKQFGGIAGEIYNSYMGSITECIYYADQVFADSETGAIMGKWENAEGLSSRCYYTSNTLKGVNGSDPSQIRKVQAFKMSDVKSVDYGGAMTKQYDYGGIKVYPNAMVYKDIIYADPQYVTLDSTPDIALEDASDNTGTLETFDRQAVDATLTGRTLFTDGDWNTLCLPFAVSSFTGTPLEHATVKTLTSSSLSDGTLTLNFSGDLTSIEAGKPYIVKWTPDLVIRNATDWNTFATNVSNGNDYSGKRVWLDADIQIENMVGTSSNKFRGTFDGNGHKLTLAFDGSEQYCAPFRYIDGATIRNLTVAGRLYAAYKFAAGFVGHAVGNNTISNCRCNVTFWILLSGDGTHGGFVANIQGGNTTITDCLFDGQWVSKSMNDGKSTNCGGFVGWTEGNNDASVTIRNCFFNPSGVDMGDGCKTFARSRNTTDVTLDNCYYKTTMGDAQGYDATYMGNDELLRELGSGWTVSNDAVVPVAKGNIVNPTFSDVTVNNVTNNVVTTSVEFKGNYSPETLDGGDQSNLYLGAGNKLYYPSSDKPINAFRGYFHVDLDLPGGGSGVRAFVLNFGEDDYATGIISTTNFTNFTNEAGAGWYDLSGRKLSGRPTKKGIYIYNGVKRVIK